MGVYFKYLKNTKMEKNRYPDFYIVGAPKAATTSLYHYLDQHPRVFFPGKKEPVYLAGYKPDFVGPSAELLNKNMVTSEDEYLKLFEEAQAEAIVGEASTDYLASEVAAENIKQRNPDAKIIIVLRNPIDRAYSEHMHLVRDQFEELSFMEALLKEKERIDKGYVPLFWHIKRGMYFQAVKRYFNAFSRQQVKVILYEDLCSNIDKVVDDINVFLGLKKHDFSTDQKSNVSGVANIRFFQKLFVAYRSAPEDSLIKKIARLVSNKTIRKKTMQFYLNKNIKKDEENIDTERQYLENIFQEDITKLEHLLGIKLKWV